MDWLLSEIEKDLFREIANIGLSKAADALAAIAKDRVLLNVPEISIANPSTLLQVALDDNKPGDLFVVQSNIKGDLEGKTLLVFSNAQADKFLAKTIKDMGPHNGNIKEIRESVLMEISNIITGSIVTQFANIFNINLYGAVPHVPSYDIEQTIKDINKSFSSFQPLVFTIKGKFLNGETLSKLPLLIIFDTDTLLKLLSLMRSSMAEKGFNILNKKA